MHLFSSARKSVGFGYLQDGKAVNAITAESLVVGETPSIQPVRVYIEKDRVVIEQGTRKEEIQTSSQCDCSEKVDAGGGYFKQLESTTKAYVDYYRKRSGKDQESLSEKESLIAQFAEEAKRQLVSGKSGDLFGKELADKLNAYEQANGRRFVVVKAEVSLLSTSQPSWNAFAEKVFERAGLGAGDILVTLPYVSCSGIGTDLGEYYFMPGLAAGSQVGINYSGLGKEYANTQRKAEVLAEEGSAKIWAFVRDIFIQTAKKYYQRYYYITAKGEILGRTSEENAYAGFPGTYDYRLVCDGRFKQYASLLKTIASLLPEKGRPYTEHQSQALVREQQKYKEFFTANPTPADFIVQHGMNEQEGTSRIDNCLTFARWYRDRIYSDGPATASPPNASFYLGRNQVEYEETLQSIDMLGLSLSPFAFDWIADALGCAYSGYYADFTNVGIYSSGVFIPVLSAGSLKGLTKEAVQALRSGKAELVRENGEAAIRFIRDGADDADKRLDDILIRLNKSVIDDLNKLTPETKTKILNDIVEDASFEKFVIRNPVISKAFSAHKNELTQLELNQIDDLLKSSSIPANAKSWATRGMTLRNIQVVSRQFDDLTVSEEIKRLYPNNYGRQITLKVTNKETGEILEIIPDYLVRDGGRYKIVDAKYTSKTADDFEFQKALTPNQNDVFGWLTNPKYKGKLEIELRANNNKLGDLRLKQGQQINADNLGIEIIQSQSGNYRVIEKTIKLK